MEIEGNRLKAFRFSHWLLQSMLKTGEIFPESKVVEGLPSDAEIVRVCSGNMYDVSILIVRSQTYDPVPDGQPIPDGHFAFERIK